MAFEREKIRGKRQTLVMSLLELRGELLVNCRQFISAFSSSLPKERRENRAVKGYILLISCLCVIMCVIMCLYVCLNSVGDTKGYGSREMYIRWKEGRVTIYL